MKLDSYYRYEIKAEAFRIMTGHMAPGKDPASASYPESPEVRSEVWEAWLKEYGKALNAMITAFERINPGE